MHSSGSRLTSRRHSFLDTFEVLVGSAPNQKRFTVHYTVVAKRSGFLRAARSERWTPATKPTDLHHEQPETFDLYLNCVYRNKVPRCVHRPINTIPFPPIATDELSDTPVMKPDFNKAMAGWKYLADREFERLINLYLLADTLIKTPSPQTWQSTRYDASKERTAAFQGRGSLNALFA